jgi:hypothetical protein
MHDNLCLWDRDSHKDKDFSCNYYKDYSDDTHIHEWGAESHKQWIRKADKILKMFPSQKSIDNIIELLNDGVFKSPEVE